MQAMMGVRAAVLTCELTLSRYYRERQYLLERMREVPELAPLLTPAPGATLDQWLESVHRAVQEHLPDVP
jgi:hypothetical protein